MNPTSPVVAPPPSAPPFPRRSRGPWRTLGRRMLKNRMAVAGGSLLIFLYLMSCAAGFIAPYHYDELDTASILCGPMLFGGYLAEPVATHLVWDDDDQEIEGVEYRLDWHWLKGGVHFHDSAGRFTLRPHVHPLREYLSWDRHGEATHRVAVDPTISLPVRFFVSRPRTHEVFSLCGLFPIHGQRHLFGVELPPELVGDEVGHRAHIFLLGSDRSGRDLFTRILYGGQISLSVGLLGIFISMTLGLLVGGISGYFGGVVDFLLMRLVELLMAIPGLYLILTMRAALPQDLSSRQTYLMIVGILALAGWASTGRVIRGMVLSLKENEYVLAARALGGNHARVILKHILPNTASFVIVTATLFVPYYILGEVALSFLGLGITEPETSWGLLLKDAQSSEILRYHSWLVLPGFFIFLAVLAYNFLGDGLRDAADPRAFISRGRPKT